MRLLVKVGGTPTMIVGYCPSETGIRAIILTESGMSDIGLSEVDPPRLPKRLRRQLTKTSHKRLDRDIANLVAQ